MTSPRHAEIWEDVIGEFPKMWMQDEYEGYQGKYWSLPPRKILPKPYGEAASGRCGTRRATRELCDGGPQGPGRARVLGRVDRGVAPVIEAYKTAIVNAEPIGAYVNDNVMVTSAAYVAEDRSRAPSTSSNARTWLPRATCTAITTRSRTRRGSELARPHAGHRRTRRSRTCRPRARSSSAIRTTRSSSASDGGSRCRPARVRGGAGEARGRRSR